MLAAQVITTESLAQAYCIKPVFVLQILCYLMALKSTEQYHNGTPITVPSKILVCA